MKFHGRLTKEEFWFQWFGRVGGREFGTNKKGLHRLFSDDPNYLFEFAEMCDKEHEKEGEFCRPCWISAQPFREYGNPMAIEKLFYDFDDDSKFCSQCKKYILKDDLATKKEDGKKIAVCPNCGIICVDKPRLAIIGEEVKRFVRSLSPYKPLIVRTYKGFHVYVFLRDVFVFKRKNLDFARKVYKKLLKIMVKEEYRFLDERVWEIARLARVPLSRHEKTGEVCEILDENLNKDKARDVEFFHAYGLPSRFIGRAIEEVEQDLIEENRKKQQKLKEGREDLLGSNGICKGFKGIIRPCFQEKLEKGQMTHAQRLAFLVEAYFAGKQTEDELIDLFRDWVDFDITKTRYFVKYFLSHEPDRYPPYRCKTIMGKGWCIEERCPLWRRKK